MIFRISRKTDEVFEKVFVSQGKANPVNLAMAVIIEFGHSFSLMGQESVRHLFSCAFSCLERNKKLSLGEFEKLRKPTADLGRGLSVAVEDHIQKFGADSTVLGTVGDWNIPVEKNTFCLESHFVLTSEFGIIP